MGDPICKWRAARPHNVVEMVNMLPHQTMPNDEFRDIMEKVMPGFFHTPYQLACQLGLYYVDNSGIYHPRFDHDITEDEAIRFLEKLVTLYYIPNPYTPRGFTNLDSPIFLERSLVEYLENHGGEADLEQALRHIIKEDVGNLSATKTLLSYSKLITFNGYSIALAPNYRQLMEVPFNRSDKDAFFSIFDSQKKRTKIKDPRQIIYYGAPGTGKSFEVDMKTKGHSMVRTTFHPDTDYSTFVGAYKPVMTTEDIKVVPVVIGEGGVTFNKNEGSLKEQRITYKFVRQAFLKAYLAAWKKYAEAAGNDVKPQFLVIEEINRGNCAQIFGDLFQLLDREGNGFSKYPIEADSDLTREINTALNEEENGEYLLAEGCKIDAEGAVDKYTSSTGHTLSEDIQQGRVLLLPPNLYIWATMNTSDQSLFPIDSAFKRRWTWKYTKIAEGYKRNANGEYEKGPDGKRIPLGWRIEGTDYTLDWWTFVQAINKAIGGEGSAEDKKLGYFFCKPDNDIYISEETFVGKVMFYLWNDVFKDSDTTLFKITDDDPTFDAFYKEDDNGYTIVNSEAVKRFLTNLLGDNADKIELKATTTAVNSDAGSDNSETAEAEEE